MWWSKKVVVPPVVRLLESRGFQIGQVVQHKVTGNKAVIIAFSDDENDITGPFARVATGWAKDKEFVTTIAEIEPWVNTNG